MNSIITQIFAESGFKPSVLQPSLIYFEKSESEDQSYYLVHFVADSELKKYLTVGLPNGVLNDFENIIKKGKPDIEKNTSLIICVKCENLTETISTFKNDILFIEEDEFLFKKNVILYTEKSIESFRNKDSLLEELRTKVLDISAFSRFKETMYENEEFFCLAEFFLKIPFLNVPTVPSQSYLSIEAMLEQELTPSQTDLLLEVISFQKNHGGSWQKIFGSITTLDEEAALTNLLQKFHSND